MKIALKHTVELINVQILAVIRATLKGTSDLSSMPILCSLPPWAVQSRTILPGHVWQVFLCDLSCKNLLCHFLPYHVNYPHTERVKIRRK